MNTVESIEYLRGLKGSSMFPIRSEDEIRIALDELTAIERHINCKLPEAYISTYAKFDLTSFTFGYKEYPPDLIFFLTSSCAKYGFRHIINEFLTYDIIIEQWEDLGIEEQSRYNWDLLKIGFTPWQGGIYLGIGKENSGKIYWVRTGGYIRDDFKLSELNESDFDGIRVVADDINEYIDGMLISFEEDSIDY